MLFKILMTISLSIGIFVPVFSQYSVKVVVCLIDSNYLNLNINFVLRKQGVVQNQGSLSLNGRFEWKGLTPGKFFLLLSALGYVDHRSAFDLSLENPSLDLGKITLFFATVRPITIKGDTTEYHVRAFQSNPNDKVENLLKQLCGISIDKAGKLSAQNELESSLKHLLIPNCF